MGTVNRRGQGRQAGRQADKIIKEKYDMKTDGIEYINVLM